MNASRKWLVLGVISSALLLIVIDMTVLYTALPRLTHDLGASASQKLWIVNIYGLVVSGLLLGMGALGDRFGHKRLFISGLVVFGVASLWAAYSASPAMLIVARALLAVGAAMMMPATLSIIRLTFEDERERALAIGVWASVASGGAALGPLLGGLLLEYFWWGSVFLINVPIVLVALPLGMALIAVEPVKGDRVWDWRGSLQIMFGLIAVAFAIKELARREASVLGALVALLLGVGLIHWFVRRQRRSHDPMIDFSIFSNRRFSSAVIAALVAAAALIGMELAFTQRLQLVLGMSPLQAGLFMLPLPLGAFVAGPLAGWFLPRVGAERLLVAALLLSGVAMLAYLFGYDAHRGLQVFYLAVLGVGLGAVMTAASSTIMQSVPASRAGMAASIEEVSYELGGAIGVTLMGSVLTAVYGLALVLPQGAELPAMVRDSLDEAMLAAEGLTPESAEALVVAGKQAFDLAFATVLALSAALLLGAGAFIRVGWARGNNAFRE
ncbi:MFS transporter [Pseudomonas sp. ABC1]|uniref:MFS transporter n=1 Tax=Pseudomonas sp. ABC1 TaxID=2748080 RepID=UPI0015C31DA6|nr:MFS transporter [Pseudomonas sp. ABC1]QLF95118.1 MFS transporter [Pseudomonas sp. ABC1]